MSKELLIVSIYDGGYDLTVYNGRMFNKEQLNKLSQLATLVFSYKDCTEFIKNNFNEYELKIICEDGGIEILK